jgi:3-phosphoshikimate 1-carboxyvinyltransferase
MGAKITGASLKGRIVPPLHIQGGQHLEAIHYVLPVASAQVKSCLLLAGRFAEGNMQIEEPVATRDHTERLLKKFKDKGKGPLTACKLTVPGDISSAAFFMVAATLIRGSRLTIKKVGINPTRMGVIHILEWMGADIQIEMHDNEWEPTADITIGYSPLTGIDIPESEIVSAIDEFPIIFIAAAFAKGKTVLRGAQELRVKESDRLAVMAENLEKLGVNVESHPDGIEITGMCGSSWHSDVSVDSKGDHRIAMAFCIAACALKNRDPAFTMEIQDTACIQTSFPNFKELLAKLGSTFKASTNKGI